MGPSGNEARSRGENFGSAGCRRFQDFWSIFGDHFLVVVVVVVFWSYNYRIHITPILSLLGTVGGGDRVHRGGYTILPSPPRAHFTVPSGGKVASAGDA